MENLTPLQLELVRVALQVHAQAINETLAKLAPPASGVSDQDSNQQSSADSANA